MISTQVLDPGVVTGTQNVKQYRHQIFLRLFPIPNQFFLIQVPVPRLSSSNNNALTLIHSSNGALVAIVPYDYPAATDTKNQSNDKNVKCYKLSISTKSQMSNDTKCQMTRNDK